MVQSLRKEYGCVLTGINTILIDNPFLLPRKKLGAVYSNADFDINENQKFYRVLLDGRLRIKLDSNIVKTSNLAKTIVFTDIKNNLKSKSKANKIKEEGIDIMLVDTIGKSGKDSRKLDIKEILDIK